MKKELTKEIKVGMVAAAAMLVLAMFFFKMGKFDFSNEGYKINAKFDFASGIEKNAPVRMLGVEVGKVESVRLEYGEDASVMLGMWINSTARLKTDAKAYVAASGLMGGNHIEIYPGTVAAAVIEPGSTITGRDPFHDIMQSFTDKGENLMKELEASLTNIKNLTTNVDGMLAENRDEVKNILENVEVTTENLKELSSDLKSNPWKIITKPRDWKEKM
jgi:phospholipid/cholesterol/gamma-HCH transport system substrate-binding protein